ncbi:deoxynucleotidyltransferase terminal-interacting protein 2 [Engystomops pustulosus]|uniref:deoxynucleotidyltransferase terminal-interacting protein 2 n=1 Tax=Engystomops pustulosus TaxID=76066 RepID=UPI003AFA6557
MDCFRSESFLGCTRCESRAEAVCACAGLEQGSKMVATRRSTRVEPREEGEKSRSEQSMEEVTPMETRRSSRKDAKTTGSSSDEGKSLLTSRSPLKSDTMNDGAQITTRSRHRSGQSDVSEAESTASNTSTRRTRSTQSLGLVADSTRKLRSHRSLITESIIESAEDAQLSEAESSCSSVSTTTRRRQPASRSLSTRRHSSLLLSEPLSDVDKDSKPSTEVNLTTRSRSYSKHLPQEEQMSDAESCSSGVSLQPLSRRSSKRNRSNFQSDEVATNQDDAEDHETSCKKSPKISSVKADGLSSVNEQNVFYSPRRSSRNKAEIHKDVLVSDVGSKSTDNKSQVIDVEELQVEQNPVTEEDLPVVTSAVLVHNDTDNNMVVEEYNKQVVATPKSKTPSKKQRQKVSGDGLFVTDTAPCVDSSEKAVLEPEDPKETEAGEKEDKMEDDIEEVKKTTKFKKQSTKKVVEDDEVVEVMDEDDEVVGLMEENDEVVGVMEDDEVVEVVEEENEVKGVVEDEVEEVAQVEDEVEDEVEEVAQERNEVEEVAQEEDEVEEVAQEDDEVEEVAQEDDEVEEVAQEDDEVEEVAQEDDEVEEVAQEDDEVEEVAQEDDEVEEVAQEDDEVEEVAQEDDEVEEVAQEDDEVEEVAQEDDEVEEVAQEDDEVEEVAQEDDEVEEVAQEDDEVEEVAQEDDEVEEVAQEDDEVEEVAQEDDEVEEVAQEEEDEVEEVAQEDDEVEEVAQEDDEVEEVAQEEEDEVEDNIKEVKKTTKSKKRSAKKLVEGGEVEEKDEEVEDNIEAKETTKSKKRKNKNRSAKKMVEDNIEEVKETTKSKKRKNKKRSTIKEVEDEVETTKTEKRSGKKERDEAAGGLLVMDTTPSVDSGKKYFLESEDDDLIDDNEEEEDDETMRVEEEEEEEDEVVETPKSIKKKAKKQLENVVADGLFVIDTTPGVDSSKKYFLEAEDCVTNKDEKRENEEVPEVVVEEDEEEEVEEEEEEEEEEFIDESEDEDPDEGRSLQNRSKILDLSSSIDTGIDVKKMGGLYIHFGNEAQAPHKSFSSKMRQTKKNDELLQKSVITPDFEKKQKVPPYSETQYKLKKLRKKERAKTTGTGWFDMKAPQLTEELKNDLKALKMRSAMDPKRFYKKDDRDGFPKYFEVGTVVDNPADYYHSRIPKKQRKRTIMEELLVDSEFRSYNKKKFKEIVSEKAGRGKRRRNRSRKKQQI